MKAIPTKYDERQYRSRLEAKWAAFFTECEIEYEYEPFDLNGWIPDFLLPSCYGKPVLVELKPYTTISECYELLATKTMKAFEPYRDKYELMYLLAMPMNGYPDAYVGFMLSNEIPPHNDSLIRVYVKGTERGDSYTLSTDLCFDLLSVEEKNGDDRDHNPFYDDVKRVWNKAVNSVQWKGKNNFSLVEPDSLIK